MDNRSSRQERARRQAQLQKQQERRRIMRIQQGIRIVAILLALLLAIIALGNSCATRKAVAELAEQLREKKVNEAQEAFMAQQAELTPEPAASPEPRGTEITLSLLGEVCLGDDDNVTDGDRFSMYYTQQGAARFFKNVKSIFEGDDLTAASLYGALTLTDASELREYWGPAYLAEPEAAEVLTQGGVDLVSTANSHSYDFGNAGYVDTLASLDVVGLGRFGFGYTETRTVSGVKVGFTGVWEDSMERDYEQQALDNIDSLKDAGAQIVVVMVSWESTDEAVPDDRQILLAHSLIDAGADLVVGAETGALRGVEKYHGKYIAYSLGTFLDCGPEAGKQDALVLQQTFTVMDGAVLSDADLTLIPCATSGSEDNDLCPVILSGSEAERVLDLVYARSALLDGGIEPEAE